MKIQNFNASTEHLSTLRNFREEPYLQSLRDLNNTLTLPSNLQRNQSICMCLKDAKGK